MVSLNRPAVQAGRGQGRGRIHACSMSSESRGKAVPGESGAPSKVSGIIGGQGKGGIQTGDQPVGAF